MITANLSVNGTPTFTSENIKLGSFSLNRYSTSAIAPEFGSVSAGELLFSIDTTTTSATLGRGDIITGTLVEGSTETSIGEFVVTNLIKGFNELAVTCLDKMILLDGEADLTGITYPITATNFINAIYRDGLHLSVTIDSGVNGAVELDDPLFEVGTTYRQVLSKVCECMGANAWYKDGLMIGFYKATQTTITSEDYVIEDTTDDGFTVDVEVTNDFTQKSVEITDNEITLRIVSNPFLANYTQAQREALAATIKSNIGNVTWYGGNVTILPDPALDIMSIVTVETMDETQKAFPITSITYGINENTQLVAKIESADNDYNYSLTRELTGIKNDVTTLESEVEEINNYFWHDNLGAHVSDTPRSTQYRNVLIDSDSVDIKNGSDTLASFGEEIVLGDTEYQQTRVGVSSLIQEAGFNGLSGEASIGASLTSSVDGYTTTGTLLIGGMSETSSVTSSSHGESNVSGKKTLYANNGHTAYMIDLISELDTEVGFDHQRLRFDVYNGITNGHKEFLGTGDWTTVFQMTPQGSFSYICEDIEANANLNSYTRQGTFACRQNATAETLSNSPTTRAFRMEVTSITKHLTNTNYVVQKIKTYEADEYVRWAWKSGSTWTWSAWRVLVNRVAPTVNWNNTYITNDRGSTCLVRNNVLYFTAWFKTSQQIPKDTSIITLSGLTRLFTRSYFPITGVSETVGQVYTVNTGNAFATNAILPQSTAYRFINAVLPLLE